MARRYNYHEKPYLWSYLAHIQGEYEFYISNALTLLSNVNFAVSSIIQGCMGRNCRINTRLFYNP